VVFTDRSEALLSQLDDLCLTACFRFPWPVEGDAIECGLSRKTFDGAGNASVFPVRTSSKECVVRVIRRRKDSSLVRIWMAGSEKFSGPEQIFALPSSRPELVGSS